MAVCSNCKNLYVRTRHERFCKTCQTNSNRSRKIKRLEHDIQFIGVDGEGVSRPNGDHDYILLSVGDQSLYGNQGERLKFSIIMEFLWSCYLDNMDAVYVGFYLGYDFTNWLKDLPEDRAWMLLNKEGIALRSRTKSGENRIPFPVRYDGWEFDMLGMKRFKLRAQGEKNWMYINDTGAFFQTSLVNVINPNNWPDGPILTSKEYDLIIEGKEERGTINSIGTPVDSKMIEYNILENDVLARLMTRYNKGLVNIGINLNKKQWFGPGQAAQEWMNNVRVPTREDHSNIDSFIFECGRSSYYGGWFEIFTHGHVPGNSFIYDINSAYPYIMSKLPCLLHGNWKKDATISTDIHLFSTNASLLRLAYCTVEGSDRWVGAAPHRTKQGRILRPLKTKGWYWLHELQAAKQAGLIDEIEVEYFVTYDPCDCGSPFANLRELYEDRIRLGKNTPEGKARKLVYNSAYGKCAQSVGAAKYANAIYASLITAGCRTLILDSIATHPDKSDAVLMVATDGIAFRTPHPNLDLNNEKLGKWTETKATNLTLFMPGMYWDDSTREKLAKKEDPTLKSRGVSARSLARQISDIDALFNVCDYPQIDLDINFSIVSPIQALARGKWETAGYVIHDDTRCISANPEQKRYPNEIIKVDGLRRTLPYQEGPELESTPYDKRFGLEMAELKELEALTPDGDIMMLFAHALGVR